MLPDNPENIPIHFIVSTGRTGSTLLSTMLNAHPEILSISEQPFTLNLIDGYRKITEWNTDTINQYVNDFNLFSTDKISAQFSSIDELKSNIRGYNKKHNFKSVLNLSFLSFYPNKEKNKIKIFVAKELILHTQIKKITETYPNAKFILLTREPRDNVQIKINRAKRRNAEYNIKRFVAAWKIVYSLLYFDLKKYASKRFVVVRYEDLVSKSEFVLKEICNFLDINFSEEMLNYDLKNKEEFIRKKDKVSESLLNHLERDHQGLLIKPSAEKIGIWKKEMSQSLAEKIWNECSELSLIFGYQNSDEIHNAKNKFGLNFKFFKIRYYLYNITRPKLYFLSPFWMRRLYRKLRY
ncbi:MAG: sulfotransferase family protein [Bacteroidota bacterium]